MAVLLWWPLSPWLSPAAAWFIFFNAVVGAIALMSCTASEHQPDSRLSAPSRRRLGRSGSSMVLDRLRSFSIFSVHHAAAGVTGALMDDDDNASAAASTGSQFYRYGTREAEEAVAAKVLESVQPERGPREVPATTAAAPPAAPVAVAPAEEVHAPPAPAPPENQEPKAEAEEQDESISMDEAYALAQRRRARAQELASPSPPPPSPPASTTSTATARAKKPAATVAEGVSRRRTKAKETLVEGKAELNARADLFIRQFREELKLQRLNSILGHAHALRSPTAAAR